MLPRLGCGGYVPKPRIRGFPWATQIVGLAAHGVPPNTSARADVLPLGDMDACSIYL